MFKVRCTWFVLCLYIYTHFLFNHLLPMCSREYMGRDDQERIECRASSVSTTQLSSAYDALRDQLKTLVITDSSDVSGI